MNILKNIKVPTGNILIVEGEKGKLEMLSLGDYGKDVNLKCDAMGLSRKIPKVKHQKLLPLSEKWVITVSTQYGCSMGCNFCDVPKVGPGKNATALDLCNQIQTGIDLHPEIDETKRLNVHFARMGEPTWNYDVIRCAKWLKGKIEPEIGLVHPVISTIMPRKNKMLMKFIQEWMLVKNQIFNGNAGLQLSINSTSEEERYKMFNGNACLFPEILQTMNWVKPKGRKITLNFAVADYEINPLRLLRYFDPDDYIIKLTPMHKTTTAMRNDIKTDGDYTEYYPYQEIEYNLKKVGYDVLVFIASYEEDMGRITCGNAILSGSKVEC